MLTKPNTYSVSRLKTYKQCGHYYKEQYVLGNRRDGLSNATLLGSIVHEALESMYLTRKDDRLTDDTNLSNHLTKTLPNSLNKLVGLSEEELNILWPKLETISNAFINLTMRSGEAYLGTDSIRTKTGAVPQNPAMTSEWKKEWIKLGIDGLANFVDEYVVSRYGLPILLSEVVPMAIDLCNRYFDGHLLDGEVLDVEMPISHWDNDNKELINPVPMPGIEDTFFNGYIDLVLRDSNGEVTIIDHKTSKSSYSYDDVASNVQLIAYAYAYEQITGTKVNRVGINHIRGNGSDTFSNVMTVATLPDDSIRQSLLDTLFSLHHPISMDIYPKHSPEPYSPCLNMFGKPCPYLNSCWPHISN